MKNEAKENQDLRKLGKLIEGIQVAMLTTSEPDGTLVSRPMMAQEAEFDGDLWFFTGLASAKVAEVRHDQNVNVAFADRGKQSYVSVSGKARVVKDAKKMKELWSPIYKAFFPNGLEDPDLALLQVKVSSAEYWDSSSGKMVKLLGFVKSLVSGERVDGGENKTIEM